MAAFHPQYVVDENHHPQAVILPVAEWERIVEELDELDDLRAYDEAKAGPRVPLLACPAVPVQA